MPLLTLQDRRAASGRRSGTVEVYIPPPVSHEDEQILRLYYFDSVAQQKLRNDLQITTAGALSVAVLVLMFTTTVTYYSSNRLQYAIMSAIIQVFVMAWVLFVGYRYKRARRLLEALDTYRSIGVYSIDDLDVGVVHAAVEVKGNIALLAPLPRLFRTVHRLYDLPPKCLFDLLRGDYYPRLHAQIDGVVAKYVRATRKPYEQLVGTSTPSPKDMERARNAIDGEIHEAACQIEWLYRDYRDSLLIQG